MTIQSKTKQTVGEEIANRISHGLGLGRSIEGMVVLIGTACVNKLGAMSVVSASLYGASLIILYSCSSLYHSLTNKTAKKVFRVFDHCSIFLLILGTYIPISLVIIGGAMGWVLFGINAFCTLVGIVFNSINLERWDKISQALYIIMGWSVVMSIYPLFKSVTLSEFLFLLAGGLAYTIGIIFYRNRKIKYMHFVWHIFVLAGSILHYFFILNYYLG